MRDMLRCILGCVFSNLCSFRVVHSSHSIYIVSVTSNLVLSCVPFCNVILIVGNVWCILNGTLG